MMPEYLKSIAYIFEFRDHLFEIVPAALGEDGVEYMPNKVEDITIVNSSVIFQVKYGQALADIVFYSEVNITGDISSDPGIHSITVEAGDNVVNITN